MRGSEMKFKVFILKLLIGVVFWQLSQGLLAGDDSIIKARAQEIINEMLNNDSYDRSSDYSDLHRAVESNLGNIAQSYWNTDELARGHMKPEHIDEIEKMLLKLLIGLEDREIIALSSAEKQTKINDALKGVRELWRRDQIGFDNLLYWKTPQQYHERLYDLMLVD